MNTPYTLITGASGGIGRELATIAARDGHHLVLIARNKAELTKLARDLTKRYDVYTLVIACDMSDPASPQQVYDTLEDKRISVDILINNAGFGDYGQFQTVDRDRQLAMIDLNIRPLTALTHLLLPDMVARGTGRIMNLGSVASFLPGPFMSVYFATKAYVLSFSEALGEELRGSGVTVTCLCPGSTKTGFGTNARVKADHSTLTSRVTAADVAAYGWAAMLRGQTIAIHGLPNQLLVLLTRFLPRRVVVRLVGRIQA